MHSRRIENNTSSVLAVCAVLGVVSCAPGCGSDSKSHEDLVAPPTRHRGSAGTAGKARGAGGRSGSGGAANVAGAAAEGGEDAGTSGSTAGSGGREAAGSGGVVAAGGAGGSAGASGAAGGGGVAAAGAPSQAGGGGSAGGAPSFTPSADATYLSDTDRSQSGVQLSVDRLSGEWLGLGTFGVRSTRSVAPHAGVFYFEATAPVDYFDLGVATAAAPLDRPAGAGQDGLSVNTEGFYSAGQGLRDFDPQGATYGFVVDYRGDHPVVHVFNGSATPGAHVVTQALDAISQPLFIHLSGMRRIAGMQATINPGNDTTNCPFTLDPAAALQAEGSSDVATALVLGWGATHAAVLNMPPALNVAAPSATSIAVGASVTLTATAADPEDGAMDAKIDWEVLSEGNGPERVRGSGNSYTFTPRAIGDHPIQVSVTDAGFKVAQQTITIKATGTLPQYPEVRLELEPGLSGSGITLSPNGLQAHWSIDQKNGVRANQGLYGDYWYVEGHRLVAETNQAIGLVIGDVSLDPYHFDITPPSCSVNTVGPSTYRDLILVEQYATPGIEYYGLAVDYRASSPTVYVIMDGKLANTLRLTDATVPIYPMLYGNVTGLGAPFDMEINFGATKFHEDPVAVLSAAGVSTDGLRLCWGTSNQSCVN